MDQRRGYLSAFAAYVLWGFFPIYFHHLLPAGPLEILANRVIWSVLTVALIITFLGRWRSIAALRHQPRKVAGLGLAAVLIGVNWFVYIYGVNSNQVIETSLGYFINPLVSVLFGVAVFKERLRTAQWAAIAIGGVAVAVIAIDYGRLPWIALSLAVSFGSYGLVKKRLGLPPTDGLFLESAALALPAAIYLGFLTSAGKSTFTSVSAVHTFLLVVSGLATAVPLLLFADAANRIPLTGLGIVQYTAPILQLGCGVLLFHEPMPRAELIGFILVWIALVVFTWDALANARRARTEPVAEPAY
ncbi:MAG TPA: EamA family transporter RarD [Micromonosporaceae bacterium]